MAKKTAEDGQPVNKSQAIRDVLAADPKLGTKDVIARLAEQGVKVGPPLVYFIKSKQNQAKRRAKRERVAESSRQAGSKNPVEIVLRVKDLSREVGGIKNLKMLVDLLAE